MHKSFYLSWLNRVRQHLELEGCELEIKKNNCLHFKQNNEDIFIPLFYVGDLMVFYCFKGEIIDIFQYRTQYALNGYKQFSLFHKKRTLRKILSNDNELQTCF